LSRRGLAFAEVKRHGEKGCQILRRSLDHSPEESLVQHLLKGGMQVFCVSWRNPTAKERDWRLDTHVAALDEGTDAVREITSSDDGTTMGACSGGITSTACAGSLAGKGSMPN
jgi:polyhydroxyalkanoate synthase